MSKLVRLKPLAPKKGYVLRSYTFQGNRYQEGRGWYEVDDATADYLSTVRQRSEDPESHAAFDVCTEAEARAIDAREAKKPAVATAEEPLAIPKRVHRPRGVLTTNDLPKAPTPSKSPSFNHEEDAGDDDTTGDEAEGDDDDEGEELSGSLGDDHFSDDPIPPEAESRGLPPALVAAKPVTTPKPAPIRPTKAPSRPAKGTGGQ